MGWFLLACWICGHENTECPDSEAAGFGVCAECGANLLPTKEHPNHRMLCALREEELRAVRREMLAGRRG